MLFGIDVGFGNHAGLKKKKSPFFGVSSEGEMMFSLFIGLMNEQVKRDTLLPEQMTMEGRERESIFL
jgi:hypothetical protein